MFEKVNPSHPDKLCDRIAGAIVDIAYAQATDPRIAVEVLLGKDYLPYMAVNFNCHRIRVCQFTGKVVKRRFQSDCVAG